MATGSGVLVREEDPVCPECGGPIGQTSTYCMHCSTDLTEYRDAVGGGSEWDDGPADSVASITDAVVDDVVADRRDPDDPDDLPEDLDDLPPSLRSSSSGMERGRLYPPGFLYNAIWVVATLVAGVVIGLGCAFAVATLVGGSLSIPVGFFAWLGSTYLLLQWRPV